MTDQQPAKAVVAWALVNPAGRFIVGMTRNYPPALSERDRSLGWRIARVQITEIPDE
jgi:hypothetical protein